MGAESRVNEAKYYYTLDGNDSAIGPVSLNELRTIAARGEINARTPVIREGAEEWGFFRDFQSGERTKEVAEAVMDRAARVAARLQTPESKSFSLGFLIGIVRFVTLPWEIVTAATRTISSWGASRFVAIPDDRLTSTTLGKVAAPLFVLLWTVLWLGDCLTMLIVGRPSFSLTLASTFGSFLMLGVSIPDLGRRMSFSAASGAMSEVFTIHDFSDRLGWVIKIAVVGYFLTILLGWIGELFSGLASLISLRGKHDANRKIP